jgi:putative membrane protein insertion efficiency factor
MRIVCLSLIRGYRVFISPWSGPACRFEPTCSQYAIEAIMRYGTLRGLGLAALRLLKCHPFHPGGEDPVR